MTRELNCLSKLGILERRGGTLLDEERLAQMVRFATVSEIGALAVFLASESVSSITGAAISIDGGWTAH